MGWSGVGVDVGGGPIRAVLGAVAVATGRVSSTLVAQYAGAGGIAGVERGRAPHAALGAVCTVHVVRAALVLRVWGLA